MERYFGRESFRNYSEGIRREWVITNGLGSYSSSTIIGANTRKHHGLFIASLHAPTDRKVLVNLVKERICFPDRTQSLYSFKQRGKKPEEGYVFQTGFSYDYIPTYFYNADGVFIKKTIAYEWEKNTVAVLYEIDNCTRDCIISLKPVFTYRDHNAGLSKKDLKFTTQQNANLFTLIPKGNKNIEIKMYASEGVFITDRNESSYDLNYELQTEKDTGMSYLDSGYCPVSLQVGLKKDTSRKISLIFTIEESFEKDANITIQNAMKRSEELVEASKVTDEFQKELVLASDKFICNRASTGGKTILAGLPWFTDWGRDTMISFTGLTLVTKRFEDARSILKTFVSYEKNGLLPNMFPDENTDPIYNTADASLWFFYCVYQYMKYDNNPESFDFVRDNLYETMKKIIYAYINGTDYSIQMDSDGLIHAGSDLDQVTWMDVRVGDRVMTPRHGKPVEINALWYNALKVSEVLADKFNDADFSAMCRELSDRVKVSFTDRFWNEEDNCLYDVVDEITSEGIFDDSKIRPNQIWAVSLPYTMLTEDKEKLLVNTIFGKLYTDFGLRTLSEDDPDYHGLYKGDLPSRDEAYHQGTAWAYIMGGFITAYLKVNRDNPHVLAKASELLKPIKQHLNDGCIGGIAEVFDGDYPHISGGCYTQAWSVGEILRSVAEGGITV